MIKSKFLEVGLVNQKSARKLSGPDIFLIISLAILGFMAMLFIIYPELGIQLSLAGRWFLNVTQYTDPLYVYLFVAISTFIANVTVFIYIPYAAIIFFAATQQHLDPFILIISSSIAAALGEFTAYLAGMIGNKLAQSKEEYKEKVDNLKKLLESKPKLVPILIYLMGATPLPDDVLLVPLGLARYGWLKSIIPTFLGKLTMIFILVFGGIFFSGLISPPTEAPGPYDWVNDLFVLFVIILVVYAVFKVDFSKLLKKAGLDVEEPELNKKSKEKTPPQNNDS